MLLCTPPQWTNKAAVTCLTCCYADDNTIRDEVVTKFLLHINRLNNTIYQTSEWMYAKKICLNDLKIDFIVFRLEMYLKEMLECKTKIGGENIHPVQIVNNLCV